MFDFFGQLFDFYFDLNNYFIEKFGPRAGTRLFGTTMGFVVLSVWFVYIEFKVKRINNKINESIRTFSASSVLIEEIMNMSIPCIYIFNGWCTFERNNDLIKGKTKSGIRFVFIPIEKSNEITLYKLKYVKVNISINTPWSIYSRLDIDEIEDYYIDFKEYFESRL
jgi:Cft2 family RNA processing exonuclease